MDIWSSAEEPGKPSNPCPICAGAGFVHPRLPSGKPDFSQVVPCRCLDKESAKERQSRLLKESGLARLHETMTFDNFDWKRVNLAAEQRENLKAAFDLALNFARSPDGWIVFMGATGCGKTHLAAAIANYRLKLGKPLKFVVVPDFLDHLRSTFSPESKISYDQLFEEIKNTPLLILDDLGQQSTTPWAREKLYQVINYRYNAGLPTVITTRYTLDEIREKIEDSISSRLVDIKISVPFNIMAPDFRGSPGPRAALRHTSKKS